MIALFVGRFQPFHLGHLKVIKEILKENEKVIIAIGSSQENGMEDNPFSFEERRKMIRDSLNREGVKTFEIIEVPDLMDDVKWVSEIRRKCSFDRVYSRNPWTARCFRKAGVPVLEHGLYEKEKYSATEIRKRMRAGKRWEKLVPESVGQHIRLLVP
ncbi:MAG: nicotinamide-nucleotide adenylyltransferase [Candidatus Aenigmarchaeota archaeon]|nr:nicotinamide-nucleotide adenylyltransferase [Candidatus Aenigmarchaeota archaeon]